MTTQAGPTALELRALLDHPAMLDAALGYSVLDGHHRGCLFCSSVEAGTTWTMHPKLGPPLNWHHAIDCVLLPWVAVMRAEAD